MARNKRKKKAKAPQPPSPNTQESSPLFRLPVELRAEIYSRVFSTTRISHGLKAISVTSRFWISPAENSLTLLRTCRRVRGEIGDSCLGQVLFSFEHPRDMLEKFTALPHQIVGKIRCLRLRGNAFDVAYRSARHDTYCYLFNVFKLLPGLCLDQLTILGPLGDTLSYESIDNLVSMGSGWKELRYITYSSKVLAYKVPIQVETMYWPRRKPQPDHWQKVLEDRDGKSSAPSVTIYRAIEPKRHGAILDPAARQVYRQEAPQTEIELADYGREEDAYLIAPGEREKEVMVVVKRGFGADYEEKGNYPEIPRFGGGTPRRVWFKLKDMSLDKMYWKPGGRYPDMVDSYVSVDDYEWTPAHANCNW
ncbi:hypothetical protein NM208_g576 [Fusarium decemcellulare]|uniref:Uncharacterized protein n=1 Tax=Fusarium decemcellulare TaxID=57161 RepID=A0ACC1SZ93_9HYPO|nr:hypothetical protein NM208_g576 [Fusarium decemcellulare]